MRNTRNASAGAARGCATITSSSSFASFFGGGGIRASSGSPSTSPISVAERTRVSSASIPKARPRAEYEPERQTENDVSGGRWLHLHSAVGAADHEGPRGLQRLQGRELLLLLGEVQVESVDFCRPARSSALNFVDDVASRAFERLCVELAPVAR